MRLTADVFLETQVFYTNNFDLKRTAFTQLIRRVEEDRVRVFLTSVTVGEVKRHLAERVRAAANAIDKVKKDLRIFANSTVPEVKARAIGINRKEVIAELTAQFDEYLKRTKATIIGCSNVDSEIIFRKYFELSHPFQERQDKRHEFPDAFAIEALRDFAKSEKREIAVITGDKGFTHACEAYGMVVMETVEEFLHKENIERESKVSQHVLESFTRREHEIMKEITDDFLSSAFELQDVEGEVDSTSLSRIELAEPLVVQIDGSRAILEVTVRMKYDADISYDDPDATHYDREDDRVYVFNRISETVEEEVEFPLEITAEFDPDDASYCNFEIGKLNEGRDFEVSSN